MSAAMTVHPGLPIEIQARRAPGPAAALSPADLAELIGAFNEVTVRLQETHETLRAEVGRLEGELREANAQLERSRRLAALGEMAAGIAHEVRNPLGSIRLHARILEQDMGDRGMEAERALAEKILAAVRGLDAVVTDVLSFAKETTVRPERVGASELLTAAVEECQAAERDSSGGSSATRVQRLDLSRADVGAGVRVMCDPVLMHRALVNVIRNALEAMTSGCGDEAVLTLDAETRSVIGPDGRSRPMAVLSVQDRGPGVSPRVMERMFNPFFTTRASGTGLGLAIVHRIVDAHGGRVSVRNHEEGGAVVELVLPSPLSKEGPHGGGGREDA